MAHGRRGSLQHGQSGDLTPAIQAQQIKRIRVASPGGQDSSPLGEGVHQLSLTIAEDQSMTFSSDELWKTVSPQPYKRPVSL